MSNPVDTLIAGFQGLVGQVPDLLQPLIIAAAGAVPFIEGEGSALIGVVGGLHPLVAASAGITGNLVAVLLVVLLSSRIRSAALGQRSRSVTPVPGMANDAPLGSATANRTLTAEAPVAVVAPKPDSKGRKKVLRWLVRFGVPGASLLGPIAVPTHFTAALFVASGIGKGRVILWQAIAIVMWTGAVTAAATGFVFVVHS